jgi:hypothetical protein
MAIKKQDESVERYLQVYLLRRKGNFSEEEIASKLEFGSPQALYQQLRADMHPVCPICGAFPVEEEHCKPPASEKRKARNGGGKASPLPPAENAMGLIEGVLQRLLLWEVSKLKRREERLEGRRFFVEHEEWNYWMLSREDFSEEEWQRFCEEHGVDPEVEEVPILTTGSGTLSEVLLRRDFSEEEWSGLCEEHGVDLEVNEPPVVIAPSGGPSAVLDREDFSEEEWSRFCEQHGVPPDAERASFAVRKRHTLDGASRVPPEPLDALIGVYVLGGGSLEELLDALHPVPASVDRDRFGKIVRRLRVENGRLATLVRGGNLQTGSPPEGLSATEHRLAAYIKWRRLEGVPDERILRELRREVPYPPEAASLLPEPSDIDEHELQRLGGLNLG